MKKATSRVERYKPFSDVEHGEILTNIDVPAELQSLFEKTPLLNHENPKSYWALLSRFAQEIRPSDAIEWLWLKDITDQSWEIVRLRRIKAALIDTGKRGAVAQIFGPIGKFSSETLELHSGWDQARELAEEWFESESKKDVESRLEKYGLDAGSITAVSFSMQAAELEAAERMLAALEIRRNNLLREIEDHRQKLGHALRQTSDKIIDTGSPLIPSRQKAAQ